MTVKACVEPKVGFIKFVYLLDGGQIVGTHLFGEDASEMVHYGAVLVNSRHTVFDVVKEVMAGVTYQEAYRTAGLVASKRASAHLAKIKSRM
jgi:pyruvate/2-oxoglutarate dehydrogenase complex dihydrolipoamide dehydrogenase (E3) component